MNRADTLSRTAVQVGRQSREKHLLSKTVTLWPALFPKSEAVGFVLGAEESAMSVRLARQHGRVCRD